MSELTDIAICKRIAEIEGVEHVKDRGVIILSENYSEMINTICSGRYAPSQVVNIIDRASYNPLTDDALCFSLMVKYKASLHYNSDGTYHAVCDSIADIGVKAFISSCVSTNNKSPNKAICLAIIEAHNDG